MKNYETEARSRWGSADAYREHEQKNREPHKGRTDVLGQKEDQMSPVFDKQQVYEWLRTIPKGKVITYGQLAELMGNRAWARAVGNALHDNPDGDKYPCYKVVNSRGELSRAYAFGGINEQKRRLEADGIVVENEKVDLKRYGMEIQND